MPKVSPHGGTGAPWDGANSPSSAPAARRSLRAAGVAAAFASVLCGQQAARVKPLPVIKSPLEAGISPAFRSLGPSQTAQFTAVFESGASWSLSAPIGAISLDGLYSAPAQIASPQTLSITARSLSDPAVTARASVTLLPSAQLTLRQAAGGRVLMGAAAEAGELPWVPDPLQDEAYAATLGAQYSMLSPENALKWPIVHPSPDAYNFTFGDEIVAFAKDRAIQVRGHNLCWYMDNPGWLTDFALTASPADMAQRLQSHIQTVVGHYRGQVFAWDVVNEAVSDAATGIGTDLRDSLWYNQPGIGLSGTGYIEQAFRWARAADPDALLFYNDYGIEDAGPKFEAVYQMVRDFVVRGVPIDGVGMEMHLDTTGYPSTAGLTENIQRLTGLGLQVHITEMDVRLPVDGNGDASALDLQAEAQTYQRILGVCLAVPGCTALQTWGFSDAHSWIPQYYPGFGEALPFDGNYGAKPAFRALIETLQTPAALRAPTY